MPGEFHGQRSLAYRSARALGVTEFDMTEQLTQTQTQTHTHTHTHTDTHTHTYLEITSDSTD